MTFPAPQPGDYYPRIFRPALHRSPHMLLDDGVTPTGVVLQMLTAALEDLFEVVEPSDGNLTTYGHRIRHQLLVACTEVEAAWAAVLRANGYSGSAQLKTKDYVKVAAPLKLRAYRVGLRHYHNYPTLEPFAAWDASRPTQSLTWYDAYNQAKHDRELNFRVATLATAVEATAAYYVLAAAQFGTALFGRGASFRQELFWMSFQPALDGEDYMPPTNAPWKAASYPF